MNRSIDHGCKWNDGDVLYSERETPTLRGIICRCNLMLWASENRISVLINLQLLVSLSWGALHTPTYVYQASAARLLVTSPDMFVLRTAYSLAQWLNFYILSLKYAKCPTQLAYHWCFPDDGVASSYILLQRARDKVRIHLPEWGPQTTREDWNFFVQ